MKKLEPIPIFRFNFQAHLNGTPALEADINQRLHDKISELNEVITAYNTAESKQHKAETLRLVFLMQQEMDLYFNDQLIACTDAYQTLIHEKLFLDLKRHAQKLGILSLSRQWIGGASTNKTAMEQRLQFESMADVLENLSPKQVNYLGEVLCEAKSAKDASFHFKVALTELFKPTDADYKNYQRFLQTHAISGLSAGNSLLFKVESSETGKIEILKFEQMRGPGRLAEFKVKQAGFGHRFIPVYAARYADYTADDAGKAYRFSSSITVEQYCPGGDLLDEIIQNRSLDTDRVIDVFTQMAKVLLELQRCHVLFPDMKTDNWAFLDGILTVLDKKTLHCANEANNHIYPFLENENYIAFYTQHYQPPELNRPDRANAVDKMHAYMLGLNLSVYLTKSIKPSFRSNFLN